MQDICTNTVNTTNLYRCPAENKGNILLVKMGYFFKECFKMSKISKKKESRQARHQKKVERERTRQKKTATIVKQTKSKPVTRTNLKDKNLSGKEQEHMSPESARKIVPITKGTEEALQEWTGNVGEVGVTNIAPTQKCLIAVVFGCDKRSDTLIAYNALEEEVYGLTPHKDGHIPKKGVRCLCEKPRLELRPLFYTKDRSIYTTMVYPLVVEDFSEDIELLVSCDSKIAIPDWVVVERARKMATLLIEDNACSAIKIKYSSPIAKAVVRKLNDAEREKMGTIGRENEWKLRDGLIERPSVFSALDQQEIIDLISEVIYIFENDQQQKVEQVI